MNEVAFKAAEAAALAALLHHDECIAVPALGEAERVAAIRLLDRLMREVADAVA